MMNFLESILRMPRVVLTVMGILLLAGFSAYTTLPKESFPAIDIPYFYVSVSQTGVSPRDAERLRRCGCARRSVEGARCGMDESERGARWLRLRRRFPQLMGFGRQSNQEVTGLS